MCVCVCIDKGEERVLKKIEEKGNKRGAGI